jgi:hypothetical protein
MPASLLVLLILAVISAAMILIVSSETRIHTSDAQNTQAYYGAEAAMEKMIVDLNELYQTQQTPNVAQIQALGNSNNWPSLSGITYSEYTFTVPNVSGVPTSTTKTISSGPNQGLMAQIIPVTLTATARQSNGVESKMARSIEVALIPVFQFGMFSDTDLSYFPGRDIDFGGRVHTNGSLFLAADDGVTVTFHSKLSAAGEVIRAEQSNGVITTSTAQNGPIMIPTASGGCDGTKPNCRDLQENEGSKVGGPTSATNTSWNSISTSTYNGSVVNGATGAKALTLPFVNSSLKPIEIVRRPRVGEDPISSVGESRLYNLAQVRVLLSDDPAELPGGAGDSDNVQLANTGTYSAGVPVAGSLNTYFAEGQYYVTSAGGCTQIDTDWVPRTSPAGSGCTSWPLIDGYLRVEARQSNGSFVAITREWLELGFARGLAAPNSETGFANSVHANAILILQQLADRNGNGTLTDAVSSSGGTVYAAESSTVTGAGARNNWYPINLYDTREGELRSGGVNTSCAIGGVMNVVELDVRNFKRWLAGTIGTTGANAENSSQNGYILFFSDRRGMLTNGSAQKVGEYGYEDIINPSDSAGNPNGTLDSGEDVNQNGVLDVYGRANLGDGFLQAAQGSDTTNDNPKTRVSSVIIARKNRVSGARHGLKLLNGSLGNLPTKSDGTGGFTVATENSVYIQGNYNANNGGFGSPHAAAAVIADAVTTLSNNWNDLNSFTNPTSTAGRTATQTWHRLAIAAGKNRSFPHPSWDASTDVGTDGGTHNFMRYLESWSGVNHNYLGSLVSLFYAQYNLGIYVPGVGAYSPPVRNYSFDTDFLDPSKIPPGTPRFQDLVNLGYQQLFTP